MPRARLLIPLLLVLLTASAMGAVAIPGRALWPWSDSLATAVQLDHLARAAWGLEDWTRGGLAWPLDGAVTQVDWLGGPALLGLPLRGLGLDPLDVHALVCGLGLLLSALAAQRLAAAITGEGPHTLIAALVGGFHPLALKHLPYANLSHSEAALIGALALGAGLERRRPGLAALGGLLLGGAGWFGFYKAAQAALVAVGLILCAALARRGDGRSWAAAAGGLGLGLLSLAPVLEVYRRVQQVHGLQTDRAALLAESWDLGWPWRFGVGSTPGGGGEALAWGPDLGGIAAGLALVLAGIGLVAWARDRGPRWPVAAVLLVGISAAGLALGPELRWRGQALGLAAPGWLLGLVPGLDGLRAPMRWLSLSFVSLGLLASRGASALGAWIPRGSPALSSGLLALLFGALMLRPVKSEPRASLALPPVYDALIASPQPGAVLDLLALGGQPDPDRCHLGHRLRGAMLHHRPLVGGLYARQSAALSDLNRLSLAWPAAETVALLRRLGVGLVVEHAPRAAAPVEEGVRCEAVGAHRLCALDPWPGALTRAEDLEPVAAPPVDALRWDRAPRARGLLSIDCDGEPVLAPIQPWRVITGLQGGAAGALVVQLDRPCLRAVKVEGAAPTLLRAAAGARPWPG